MLRSKTKIQIDTNMLNQGTSGVLQAPEIILNGFSLKFDRPASPRTRHFFESCGTKLEYTDSDVILTGGVIEKSKLLAFQVQISREASESNNNEDLLLPILKSCQLKKDGGKIPSIGLAFRRAVAANNEAAVEALLPHANIDEQGPESGKTALHIAAIYGRSKLAALLLKNGARKSIKDNALKTAADYATEAKENKETLLELLVEPQQNNLRKMFHPDIEATLTSAAMKEAQEQDAAGVQRNTMLDLFEFSKKHPEFMQGSRKSSNSKKYVFVPEDYDSSDESSPKISKIKK